MSEPAIAPEMIAFEVQHEIRKRLHRAELEHDIQIIYACESGSRAWGFASTDSDYDVRFIYVHRSDWYMAFNVERQRDVVEYPIVDEIDCNGWDLRKALHLYTRTNGALLEWLNSPIVYIEQGQCAQRLKQLAKDMFNPTALCYHYSHMARGNAREYLNRDAVRLKKYFYVLRPLLSIRYIEQYQSPPPIVFEELLYQVAPESIIDETERLLAIKRQATESDYGPPNMIINRFIYEELERHGGGFKGQGRPDIENAKANYQHLNQLFRDTIKGAVFPEQEDDKENQQAMPTG